VIIWLNGLFGGGKSALAANSRGATTGTSSPARRPSVVFCRTALAGHARCPGGGQEQPLRRTLTTELVSDLARYAGGPVIVPMTVFKPAYAAEASTPLRQGGGCLAVCGRARDQHHQVRPRPDPAGGPRPPVHHQLTHHPDL
jgi:hypothetical protein